jgi:hypothetical protein
MEMKQVQVTKMKAPEKNLKRERGRELQLKIMMAMNNTEEIEMNAGNALRTLVLVHFHRHHPFSGKHK